MIYHAQKKKKKKETIEEAHNAQDVNRTSERNGSMSKTRVFGVSDNYKYPNKRNILISM